jgi:hypothetical protein
VKITVRWLGLFVVALLLAATSVAAIRGSDDDGDRSGTDGLAAPVPTSAPDVTRAPEGAPVQEQEAQSAPAPSPQVDLPTPPVRMGNRTSLPARKAAAAPLPAQAGSPAAAPSEAPYEAAAGPQPGGAPGSQAPPPGPGPAPAPGETPPPGGEVPNPDLISGTFEVSFGQAQLLVHVAPAPNPDADVTVGETKVVGDHPPAERTGFTIGGSLAPGDSVPRPAFGAAPGLGVAGPGTTAT